MAVYSELLARAKKAASNGKSFLNIGRQQYVQALEDTAAYYARKAGVPDGYTSTIPTPTPIPTPAVRSERKVPDASKDALAAREAAQRLSYSLPAEAQASVGRQNSPMTGTELREVAANQEQIKKDLNTLDLYVNRGLTGTERRENYNDMVRAAQRAAAEEEQRRTAGLTGTERLAPVREAEQQKKELESELANAQNMVKIYGELHGSHQTSAEEKAQALEQRTRFEGEAERLSGELAKVKQNIHELTMRDYSSMPYAPDFHYFSSEGAKMRRSIESSTGDPDLDAYLDMLGEKAERFNKGTFVNQAEHKDIMEFLSYEENKIYNYLLAKYGQASADIFLERMTDELNRRKGGNIAEVLARQDGLAELVQTANFAFRSGLEQFGSGLRQLGKEEALAPTSVRYASQDIRENLSNVGPQILGSSLGQLGYDALSGAGNMAPSVLLSTVTGVPLLGLTAMGASAGGNAYTEALNMGYSVEDARNYAVLVGVSEVVLERVLSGIPAFGGSGGKLMGKIAQANKGLARAARAGKSILGEATEEGLQTILEPIFRNMITGENVDIDWENVVYDALLGGFLGSVYGNIGDTQPITNGKNTLESGQNSAYDNIKTGEIQNGAEEIHLREGGQWADGKNTGRQIPGMEEGAGRNPGRETGGRSADGETAALTYGREVSAASLGIDGGTDKANVRLVTGGDTTATRAAKQMAREYNLQLVLFAGNNLEIRQRNGSIVSARALIDGDKVYVRADHAEFTSVQLMGHETGHNRIARGEIDPNTVRRRIRQTFGGIKTARLAAMYAAAYAGTGMTASEVWEEVICDSLGDMNIFAGTARESNAWELLKETKAASVETQTESTRGPPAEGKASREVNGGKYEANERTDDSDFAGTEQPAGRFSPRRENTGNSRKVRAGDTYKNLTGKERGRIRKAILSALQTDEEIARFILREINSNKFVEDVYDKIAVHGEKLTLEGVFPGLREAVYAAADMNNQQTYEVNEKTGKAAWTKEHINWLFREYGMGDKKWHQQYAQAYAARMSPDDFLSLTATDRIKGGIELEAVRKYGELDIEKLKEDRTSPMLVVDMETGAVEGHEGRHRMVLLNNEGIDNVPVVIVPYNHGDKYNRTKIGSISLSGQRWTDGAAPGKVEIRDVTPFSTEYRSEVERLFGGDAEIKFSRELAEKGNDILLAKLPADRLLYTERLLEYAKRDGNIYAERLLQRQIEKAQKTLGKTDEDASAPMPTIYADYMRKHNMLEDYEEGLTSDEGFEDLNADLEKDANGDTISEYHVQNLKLTHSGKVINPMPVEEYIKVKGILESRGIEVFAAISGDDLGYMLAIGAEGTYSNGRITHVGAIPSRGTMYEELIHMIQAREYGELDTTDFVELYRREIEANRKLIEHSEHYKLDAFDISDIKRNLKGWEESFAKAKGMSYDDFFNGN